MAKKAGARGITLIELMAALAVAATLTVVAASDWDLMVRNSRLRSQAAEIHHALLLARTAALVRASRVTVCKSRDGATCAGSGGWEQGWIVFSDPTNPVVVDAGEEILHAYAALAGANTLRGNTPVRSYVSYGGGGFTRTSGGGFQAGTLVVCDDRGIAHGRAIIVNAAGRPRVSEATASSLSTCTP